MASSAYDIYCAAAKGNLALQEELKKCANINSVKYIDGGTALHLAALRGHVQASQLLISNKANVHEKDKSGQTPLHAAALNGRNTVVKVLLENSSCVSEVDNDMNTPLHLALAHSGDLDTVKLLLQHSEDVKSLVNTVNKNQHTPLHLAAGRGNNSVTKVLLENFSCVSEVDNDKNTPFHLALVNPRSVNSDIPKLMLQSASDEDKKTLLHLELVGECDIDVIKLIIGHLDDVKNVVNENQQTPLHLAAKKGNNSVTKLFLEKSICVSTVDEDKNTPLHLALTHSGDLDTVRLLLQHSEDIKSLVNGANQKQETPLQLAIKNEKHNIANRLRMINNANKSCASLKGILGDPKGLHSLIFYDDFKAIDNFLQVK